MRFSENWLREWASPDLDTDELVSQLIMAGLEVDGVQEAAPPCRGVVVAQVLAVAKHPKADRLSLCRVDGGGEPAKVVCGAPNVRAGMKVPYAQVGAVLGSDFTIGKAKFRGATSHGMICSEQELGLAERSEGIMELPPEAPLGEDIRAFLQLDDRLLDMDLTPNRGDCLSIAGLAREVAALNGLEAKGPAIKPVKAAVADEFPVTLESPADCPRYLGRIIRNINPHAQSPRWLLEKLRRCGLRGIDPVVDVTNYVLLELGQPMHAFDFDKLKGGIKVRLAQPGEKLALLDGSEAALREDTLVIADHERAIAMAGIMGGLDSAVTGETRHIFLESAFFSPSVMIGKARSYNMQTDASHRFERGVDFNLPRLAMERATGLLLEIVGGQPGEVLEAAAALPAERRIVLRRERLKRVLGAALPSRRVEEILAALKLKLVKKSASSWTFAAPSHRFDLEIEADLIEEVARVQGYDKLPAAKSGGFIAMKPSPEAQVEAKAIRGKFASLGYQEVITYSFVARQLQESLGLPNAEELTLSNPISQDLAVMRGGLWPGLLNVLKHNQHRQRGRVRIFETGLVFSSAGKEISQVPKAGALAWGEALPEQWGAPARSGDFFDMKGDVEAVLGLAKAPDEFAFEARELPALQAGQAARITRQGAEVGWLGVLDADIQRQLDIPGQVLLCELDLQALAPARLPVAGELSKFPSVRRDLAIIVEAGLEAGEIERAIKQSAGDCLVDLLIFDVYQGENIGKNKKSLALGLTFQHHHRTLTDEEINAVISSCINALEQQFSVELRV